MTELTEGGMDRDQVLRLFAAADVEYFLKYDPGDIAWQMRTIDRWDAEQDGPLVRVRRSQHGVEGATEVFVYCLDRPQLFAVTVAVFDALDLSVLDARIHTGRGHVCFNTFMVLDRADERLSDAATMARVEQALAEALADPQRAPQIVRRRVPRELRQFTTPTQVDLRNDGSGPYTEMRVVAADRPGLLARLGLIFVEEDLDLMGAKIATLRERIDDVFFISDADGGPSRRRKDRASAPRRHRAHRRCHRAHRESRAGTPQPYPFQRLSALVADVALASFGDLSIGEPRHAAPAT